MSYYNISSQQFHFTNDNVATRKVIVEKWPEQEKLDLILTSVPIRVESSTIKAVWSQSLADDLLNYQSIDTEAELTTLLEKIITRKVIVEKWRPNSIFGTGTWTPEFTTDYYELVSHHS